MSQCHAFSKEHAMKYGVECAILLNHFIFWIEQNQAVGRNFHDGRTWMYQTLREIEAIYPYWKKDTISRNINKLVSIGVLIKGNYNKSKLDKTVWYAFKNEKMFTISRKREMEFSKMRNGFLENETTIPDTKPNTETNKVNDTEPQKLKKDTKSEESVNLFGKRKKSVCGTESYLSEEQKEVLGWLKSLEIDTSLETLTWWAKTYTLLRLEEVYQQAIVKPRKTIGGYMNKLLKENVKVTTGRIKVNRDYCKYFIQLNPWSLEINQKYAVYWEQNSRHEINFDLEPSDFQRFLNNKYVSAARGES